MPPRALEATATIAAGAFLMVVGLTDIGHDWPLVSCGLRVESHKCQPGENATLPLMLGAVLVLSGLFGLRLALRSPLRRP